MQERDAVQPLVYSCSGASSAAQMANHLAVRLDRLRVADMSCIAGLGGDVGPLLRTAKSGRPIIVIDGCHLHCALRTLQRHEVGADRHYDLAERGVAKRPHADFSLEEAKNTLNKVKQVSNEVPDRYFGYGKRKSSEAEVYVSKGNGKVIINN